MLHSLLAALDHLSVVPLGSGGERAELRRGREGDVVALFPLAGLVIALAPGAVLVVAARVLRLGSPLAEALAVAALAAVTGGRHLEGLAAGAERLAARLRGRGRTPRRSPGRWARRRWRWCSLVKFAALASLVAAGGPARGAPWTGALLALLLAGALGRWSAVVAAFYAGFVPAESGPGDWAVSACGGRELRWSLLMATSAAVLIGLRTGLGSAALALGGCYLLGWGLARVSETRLGGVTGRTLDAAVELGEVLTLVALCVLAR